MAPLFSKRLSCFYCGRRSAQADRGLVRKWRCNHCEAINYLDEKGEITDPPAAETNPTVYGPGASSPPFESADFTASGLFCAQCIRNQHLFTTALASYFPSTDDPTYGAYEREYPQFRQHMEERYPQVCVKCEPYVKERIRQAGYEAKSDHLRRMMDRSKAGRVARHARNRNWRSILVFAGAIGYWGSVAGQLVWGVLGALDAGDEGLQDQDYLLSSSWVSYVQQILQERQLPRHCSADFAAYAGLSLVVGILSLWWNPKLRLKVEGRGGRFAGLGEYYQVQLIVIVVRCVFWAVLKDPSSSGLQPTMPPALHLFMFLFTVLSVAISRRVVQYDTRPLVSWTETTPTASPARKPKSSPVQSSGTNQQQFTFSAKGLGHTPQQFPIEKLAIPQPSPREETAIPTPPPEADDMDWTPSVQHEIRPTHSVYERDQKSALDGPLPFYGSLPAAPKPPAWNLRSQPSQPKPIEQVVERNPFHRGPSQTPNSWTRNQGTNDAVFAPPRFFPMSDHNASTGLESLFDQTFTIKTPEEEGKGNQQPQQTPQKDNRQPVDTRGILIYQCFRLGLLMASLLTWCLSQFDLLAVPGNYIEVASLGSASLIAGFALLEVLKQPIMYWNGMEILVYFAELAAAVHLGGNLPRVSFAREYFDRYGKLLLIFMAAQEALGLLSLCRTISTYTAHAQEQPQNPQARAPSNMDPFNSHRRGHQMPPVSRSMSPSQNSLSTVPPLSFSSTAPDSRFSSQAAEPPQYHSRFNQGFSSFGSFGNFGNSLNNHNDNENHSFTLNSLKENEADESDAYDHDSDTETTMTTATTATNATIRNIRYGEGGISNDNFYSPRRSELGPGIGGLSLDDKPARRVTRSQTKQNMGGDPFSRRYGGRFR